MKITKPSVTLEWITPNALKVIERAGRTCYKSEWAITEDSAPKFIEKIMKRGHFSVLEHASASLRIICCRGVSHEWVRHRLWSYSQESTRYCNYGSDKFDKEIIVIKPPQLNGLHEMFWKISVEQAERSYLQMLSDGCSPQIARSVLPTCLKTEFVATTNFRNWAHFFNLRCAPAAHPQMVEVANMAKAILSNEVPEIFTN